jgi:hypothetical protein
VWYSVLAKLTNLPIIGFTCFHGWLISQRTRGSCRAFRSPGRLTSRDGTDNLDSVGLGRRCATPRAGRTPRVLVSQCRTATKYSCCADAVITSHVSSNAGIDLVRIAYMGLRGIEWVSLGSEGPRKLCIS